jgi:hypothetical protein
MKNQVQLTQNQKLKEKKRGMPSCMPCRGLAEKLMFIDSEPEIQRRKQRGVP